MNSWAVDQRQDESPLRGDGHRTLGLHPLAEPTRPHYRLRE